MLHFRRVSMTRSGLISVVVLCLTWLLSTPLPAQDSEKDSWNQQIEAVKWRNIGPHRGGRSVCASGIPGNSQVYLMGTTGGGVWKTEDAGQHWVNVSDGYMKTGSVGAIAVSESNPNVVYVGMGEHAPRGVMTSHGDGVYRSTDGGKTWVHMGLAPTQHIARIVIHPRDPNTVYVAAQGALTHPPKNEASTDRPTAAKIGHAFCLLMN